jgi:aryl-alcohol dehydrogenase-like predicted oxidoreductase
VNRLALGAAQFGLHYGIANKVGQVTLPEVSAMLKLALSEGVDTIDTAIAYGESESFLGDVGVKDFKLITKLPAVPDDCADVSFWIQQQVRASLNRLRVPSVYGLLLHRSDQLIGSNGPVIFDTLKVLKDRKEVQKIGISIYSPMELEALIPRYSFDLIQAPFNLVDRRLLSTGWMQRLKQDGVEIHTRSVFLQGLLLMAKENRPPKFSSWQYLWDSWHRWLEDQGESEVDTCLAYPLSFPEIDRVVVGTESVSQLTHILRASMHYPKKNWPDLQCEDENLINPARWNSL